MGNRDDADHNQLNVANFNEIKEIKPQVLLNFFYT